MGCKIQPTRFHGSGARPGPALVPAAILIAAAALLSQPASAADSDGDGVADEADSCLTVPNADQCDSDQDGYGNLCDCDYDQDEFCSGSDFNVFVDNFGDTTQMVTDQDCDFFTGGSDFNRFVASFGGPPGPSGLDCAGNPPCHSDAGSVVVPPLGSWSDLGRTLARGPTGAWDNLLAGIAPCGITKRGGTYFLYYIGGDGRRADGGEAFRSLGVATSTDGVDFTKYAGNPVVEYFPNGNDEEGVFSCAIALAGDGTTILYYGALQAHGPTSQSVDIAIRMQTSTDGLEFGGDRLIRSESGAEISPVGLFRAQDGTWHLYYINSDPESWNLHLLSGPSPTSLGSQQTVLSNGDLLGGASPTPLGDGNLALFLQHGSFSSPLLEAWTAPENDPGDPRFAESYDGLPVFHAAVLRDDAAGVWRAFTLARAGANEIRQYTAPLD